jgi:ppGpp synthetase/RelA/SpoT-type nucleotidyltranferase
MAGPSGERTEDFDRNRIRQQLDLFARVRPRYERCAETLKRVLDQAVAKYAPLAVVEARAKTLGSFAEKIQRKKVADPVNHFTDLCGARVIVCSLEDIRRVCGFIEKRFHVDRKNSMDPSQRLRPSEFGYRSFHYIVQFRRGAFPNREIGVEIPREALPDLDAPMNAEIQVRTLLEHAWAVFAHDKSYKSAFKIPVLWERELAGLAAMLEGADEGFSRINAGLTAYAANYGAYMTEQQMRQEIATLQLVRRHDPANPEIAHRIGKLHIALGEWDKAAGLLEPYAGAGHPPILRDLGVALCKLHRPRPESRGYRLGQRYLALACRLDKDDVDAVASLAGTWKGIAEKKARRFYRLAFELDPTDPYPLSNYLEYEILARRDVSLAQLMKPTLDAAIRRCRDQAEVGMNLPWAHSSAGLLQMLLGRREESLAAYAKSIELSASAWMIETTLSSLERFAAMRDKLPGYERCRALLLSGLAAKFPNDVSRARLRERKRLSVRMR